MTLLAGLRESALYVVGVRCCLEIFQMARDACRDRDVVVVVDMAIGALAWWHGMGSGQREAGFRMIEGRRLP